MTTEGTGENVTTPPEDEEEEVVDYSSGMGEWDGQTYSMKHFPCEPQETIEGNTEWSQTMGKVYVSYRLTDENAELTASQLYFEVCTASVKVTIGQQKGATEIFGGFFRGEVRAGLTWWDIVDNEDGRKLSIIFYKNHHEAWNALFKTSAHSKLFAGSVRYSWSVIGAKEEERIERPDDVKPREIKADCPLYEMEVPSQVSWQALCIGLDDVQDFDEYVVVNIFLDPKELLFVNKSVPNEDFFRADITEKEVFVYFRIYDCGQPMVAFHGVLEQECVPQLTTWEYIQNARHPQLNGYTPCLQLVLTKPSESQGSWPRVFATAKHASEFHAPSILAAEPSAQPKVAPLYTGVAVNADEVVKKFHELLSTGLSSREATSQAIAYVRKHAEAGKDWALDKTGYMTGTWTR